MKVMGRHVVAEIFDCDEAVLNNLNQFEAIMMEVVDNTGFSINDSAFHQDSSEGISGVIIIPKSHMMIHTWPQEHFATVDMYTCNEALDPWQACQSLVQKFGASHMTTRTDQREIEIGDLQEAV